MIKCLKWLFDFILPPRCLHCGKIICNENSLCPECFEKISFITQPYCKHCGCPLDGNKDDLYELVCLKCLNKKNSFRLCRSAIKYDEFSRKLLLDFKFADHVENKLLLARWLFWAGKDIFDMGADMIIPVPLHYTRLIQRKYNQSAILAAELSKLCSIPAVYNVLKKTKYTAPQVRCNSKDRKINVKNAFKVTQPCKIKGKRIILIDDVYTTGATTRECIKILKQSGALSIDVLTVARVCL